jgi:hypothetical protein
MNAVALRFDVYPAAVQNWLDACEAARQAREAKGSARARWREARDRLAARAVSAAPMLFSITHVARPRDLAEIEFVSPDYQMHDGGRTLRIPFAMLAAFRVA